MKLLEFYEEILKFIGMRVSEDGFGGDITEVNFEPFIFKGKKVTLPTDNNLKYPPKDPYFYFNPLSENVISSKSLSLELIIEHINFRLGFSIFVIVQALLRIAASPDLHSKLSPEQTEALLVIKDADIKTTAKFAELVMKRQKASDDTNSKNKCMINLYTTRASNFKGKAKCKAAIAAFPLYAEMKEKKVDKLTVKDQNAIIQAMEFIFPDIAEPDSYSYASTDSLAPLFHATMTASGIIANRMNELFELYKDYIVGDGILMEYDLSWSEVMNDLSIFSAEVRRLPQVVTPNKVEEETVKPIALPVAPGIATTVAQPQAPINRPVVPQKELPVVNRNGMLDYRAMLNQTNLNNQPPPPPPQFNNPVQQSGLHPMLMSMPNPFEQGQPVMANQGYNSNYYNQPQRSSFTSQSNRPMQPTMQMQSQGGFNRGGLPVSSTGSGVVLM